MNQEVIKLSDEELLAWAKEETPVVVEWVKKMFAELFPSMKYFLEIVDGTSINLDGITLDPYAFPVKSIVGVKEFPGYTVSAWKHIPSTQWEPDDIQEIPLAELRGGGLHVATALVQQVIHYHILYWSEREGEKMMVDDLRDFDPLR